MLAYRVKDLKHRRDLCIRFVIALNMYTTNKQERFCLEFLKLRMSVVLLITVKTYLVSE